MKDSQERECAQQEDLSFKDLFDQSLASADHFEVGQKIDAAVVAITEEWIFLDLGGKTEGHLDAREFRNDENHLTVAPGDVIGAYILSAQNNEYLLTTKIGRDSGHRQMEQAWRNGIPVEGTVDKEIKGGFDVSLSGGIRAFCPYSQIGRTRPTEASGFIGKRLTFIITSYSESGRNIVISRRPIIEEEERKRREKLKTELKVGMKIHGTVTAILPFGAFVDIGGVQGLLPLSELSWDRVESVGDLCSVDQEIDVVIVNLEWEKNRITLSLRSLQPDPWERAADRYTEGARRKGTVTKIQNFGAFVSLEPGIDGLIHISKLGGGNKIFHPREALKIGSIIEVTVEKVDLLNRRISLVPAETASGEQVDDAEALRRFTAPSSASFGTLGDLLKKGKNGRSKG
ncbi:MAG: S1 RNA-binding domain-containing protein [Deltaproteobacteria bacterium]|nr:S1 RNA-binding domain-containing protein [Deltaproteobacteria bacterium]